MSKSGKIFLSGGLILASGTYAWWHHATAAPPPLSRIVAAREAHALSAAQPAAAEPPAPSVAAATPNRAAAPTPTAPETAAHITTPSREPKLALAAPRSEPAPSRQDADAPETRSVAPESLAPPDAMVSNGRYADGEFIGIASDGEWGPVRVKITVKNGGITDVVAIEYPNHRERSAEISEWAIPQLVQETLKAQSEKIDWITQASFTSENFQQSLASALLRAQKPPAS